MEERFLLDCTLRDGGYLNDWHYGKEKMRRIFAGLISANVDYIEVGFLDERRPYDLDRSINPSIEAYEEIFQGVDKGHSKALAMIDFGTCSIEKIKDHHDGDFIDGIRVIFKKEKKEKALAFVKQVKDKGYIVFAQMVSVTAYQDNDLEEFVPLAIASKADAVSMVDTYGLLDNAWLDRFDDYLDEHLPSNVMMGFHAHNNLQLAFSNASHFLGKSHHRNTLADGTLFGHGKSAGNAPTELLASYMNRDFGKEYDLGVILDLIEKEILPLRDTLTWGYQYDFFLCANRHVHPNYVSYLRKKGCDGKTIDALISKIRGDEMLLYSEAVIEKIFNDYESSR